MYEAGIRLQHGFVEGINLEQTSNSSFIAWLNKILTENERSKQKVWILIIYKKQQK